MKRKYGIRGLATLSDGTVYDLRGRRSYICTSPLGVSAGLIIRLLLRFMINLMIENVVKTRPPSLHIINGNARE